MACTVFLTWATETNESKDGEMLFNRECLDSDHPENLWNHLVFNGIDPSDYGIEHPLEKEYKDYTRSQLIDELNRVKKEYQSAMRQGFL